MFQLASERQEQAHRGVRAGVGDLDIAHQAANERCARLHDEPVEPYSVPDRMKAKLGRLYFPATRFLVPGDELTPGQHEIHEGLDVAQIGRRVAKLAQLPVEDGRELVAFGEKVVKPEIVVRQPLRCTGILHVRVEPGDRCVDDATANTQGRLHLAEIIDDPPSLRR